MKIDVKKINLDLENKGFSGPHPFFKIEELELINKIKSYNPITKIISLCSKSFPEINKQYKKYGVDHCLDKATEFNQLIEIIENYKPTIAN